MTLEKMKHLNDLCIAAKILGMTEAETYKKVMLTDTYKNELAEEVMSVISPHFAEQFRGMEGAIK